MPPDTAAVRRRRVFYIPGYDPFHPRRYRELYRKEGADQAAISGYALQLQARAVPGAYGWQVTATMDGITTVTDVQVLVWSDLVRASLDHNILRSYAILLRTIWIYLSTGALFRLMRLRKGPILAAFYPVVMFAAQLAVACGLGWALGALVAQVLPAVFGWLAAAAVVPPVLIWFRRQDGRFLAYYLMHDYAYAARGRGANPPALEDRMTAFRATIAAALHEGADEVLVVGHSAGAHLGVSILADLLRAGPPPSHPPLGFLTVGQVIPMISFLPKAHRLRADLHDLSRQEALTWVDVTAPGDGCAFALCDPVAVSGVAPRDKRWPLVISAAFTQTLSPARWKHLRWRFFRLHFQYLCAFDRPGDYDYFRITAGPLTLAARYAGRAPSKNRIDVAVSSHTSMAA